MTGSSLRRQDSPYLRVRSALAEQAGESLARELPRGYHRIGQAALVRIPERLLPWERVIGESYRKVLGVDLVLRQDRIQKGASRAPGVFVIAGTRPSIDVTDGGIVWRTDPTRLMFSKGNMEERHRMARIAQPGEVVADLFAGIGYFALPLARYCHPRAVVAVEKNPVAFAFLEENIRLNRLENCVSARLGDNRAIDLPRGSFDRVLMGYLPSALPFLDRAAELLHPGGGWVHLHTVVSTRCGDRLVRSITERVQRAGRGLQAMRIRRVKSYGPSRDHVVADLLLVG